LKKLEVSNAANFGRVRFDGAHKKKQHQPKAREMLTGSATICFGGRKPLGEGSAMY
jgi:hypothetical protein